MRGIISPGYFSFVNVDDGVYVRDAFTVKKKTQLKNGGSVQTINQRRDRSLIVRIGEQNQLFVDEVIVGEVPGMSSIEVLLGGREDEGRGRKEQ